MFIDGSASFSTHHGMEDVIRSPVSMYEDQIRMGYLQKDELQVKVVKHFHHLHEEMKNYHHSSASSFSGWVCRLKKSTIFS